MTNDSAKQTPMTDKLKIPSEALLLLGQKGVPEQIVKAILTLGDHARQLERELTAKSEALESCRKVLKIAHVALLEVSPCAAEECEQVQRASVDCALRGIDAIGAGHD